MQRTYRRGLTLLLAFAIGLTFASGTARAQLAGGLNLQFTPSPTTAQTGQPVTFSYTASPPAVAPPFASITTISIDFGDGQSASGVTGSPGETVTGSVSHSYTTAGVYTPVISAQASNGGHGSLTTSVTITGGGPPPPPGTTVTYGPGWVLIGVPDGSVLPSGASLYTWQAGDRAYETATTPQAGKGYWIYFPGTATVSLSPTPDLAQSVRIPLPAGQWIMIGNPYSNAAAISGADAFFAYNPESGYQSVSTLFQGLGAWAFSSAGGTAVITSCASC